MRFIKNPIYLLILVLCQLSLIASTTSHSFAESDTKTDAVALHTERVDFANNFANIVLAVISDNKKTFEQRKENLENAFSKSVDIDWIAKFVIGRTWNNATDEQRLRYTELYRKFLTKTYVENFAENPDTRISSIKILNVKDNNDSDFSVDTSMKLTNQETMNVSYLVRENEGRYKVLDIAIENVSLITTHRAEFAALAVEKGLNGVISKLDKLLGEKTNSTLSMN